MIAFYVALLLSMGVLATLFLLVRPPRTPDQPDQSLTYAASAVALSFLIALIAPHPISPVYKGAILLGLVLTLIATGLLFSRFLPGYAAHAHLLWAYVIYFTGFTAHTRLQLPTPWALLIVAAVGILYWQLSRYLHEVWGAVVAYAILLALAAWQAMELVAQNGAALWTWAALAGIVLAAGAHTLQAVHHFRRPLSALPYAQAAFLLAQTILAWSVWGYLG